MSDTPTEESPTDVSSDDHLSAEPTSHSGSTWKVLGETSDWTGIGVLGHATSGSGATNGVRGVVDSPDFDAHGVHGAATGTGGIGVFGFANDGDATAVRGEVGANTSPGGTGYGIVGETQSTGWRSAGIYGNANANSGQVYGVYALTNSVDNDAAGLKGIANGSTGSTYGVHGETNGEGTEAAGVKGEAAKRSGWTYGVHGVTPSENINAAGVRAEATGSAQGLFAESTKGNGVAGVTKDGGQIGVFGINNADTNTASTGYGVRGQTDSVGSGSAGVYGRPTQASGLTYGVKGVTDSVHDGAAGVYGQATNSSGTAAAVKADGHVDVSKVGMQAWLTTDQEIQNDNATVVVFDGVDTDHFNAYDSSTGAFSVPVAGDYHVSFCIDWSSSFSGDTVKYRLLINGTFTRGLDADWTESGQIARSFSKTVMGLTAVDTIEVQVYQDSGSSKYIDGYANDQDSYLTIHKVG